MFKRAPPRPRLAGKMFSTISCDYEFELPKSGSEPPPTHCRPLLRATGVEIFLYAVVAMAGFATSAAGHGEAGDGEWQRGRTWHRSATLRGLCSPGNTRNN